MTATPRPGVAVISGAASGMGAATAARFLAEGWNVISLDLSPVACEADSPGALAQYTVDVRDVRAVEDAVARGAATVGEPRVVVNAAGVFPPTRVDDYDEQRYRAIFDINVLGTLNVTAATLPYLRRSGDGAVVNFASIDAYAVSLGQLLYSASKAAVTSMTRSLAAELAPDGIRVNGVAPGCVDTPGNRATGRMAAAIPKIPLGRPAAPEEIADWVWFLTAEGRAGYLTGETIVISGGKVMR